MVKVALQQNRNYLARLHFGGMGVVSRLPRRRAHLCSGVSWKARETTTFRGCLRKEGLEGADRGQDKDAR